MKHGYCSHPLYKVWEGMKRRCAKSEYYSNISLCKEWINDPKNFIEWAIDQGYKKGLSIDRIDNKGDYSPDNCRFTDRFTQMSNTRKNVFIEFRGEVKTISQWARDLNLHKGTVSYRYKNGIPLNKPVKK